MALGAPSPHSSSVTFTAASFSLEEGGQTQQPRGRTANPAVNRACQFPSVSGRRSPARGLCLAHHPRGETETQTSPWEESAASSSAFISRVPGGAISSATLLHRHPPQLPCSPVALAEVPAEGPASLPTGATARPASRGTRVSFCTAPQHSISHHAPSEDQMKVRVLIQKIWLLLTPEVYSTCDK